MTRGPLLLLVGLSFAACNRSTGTTTLTASGALTHSDYGYVIHPAPLTRSPLDGEWNVISHVSTGAQRMNPEYLGRRELDVDDDTRLDDLGLVPIYDFRAENRRDNGTIWVRSIPIPHSMQERELPVLLQNYVENIAGNGYLLATVGPARLEVEERRWATQVLDTQQITVARSPAAAVLFDAAAVNQLQIDRTARAERAMVVLIRTSLRFRVRSDLGVREWPVLMLFGYSNTPGEFDRHIEEFASMLHRLELPATGS